MTTKLTARQQLFTRYSLASFVILILAATVFYALPQTSKPFKGSPGTTAVVDANTAFAVDLYQKLKSQPGNLFFSPYSISSALAMTYAGARGQTESEMAKVLHFDGQTNVHSDFRALNDRINDLQRVNRIKLLTANSLWYQHDYRFMDPFMKLVLQDYHAEARPVDFAKAPDAAANDINSWVDRKTEGKIQNVAEGLNPSTRLVLCNAIYFKGKWETQFDPANTRPAPFHVSSNETVTVPMMTLKDSFKTVQIDASAVGLLELPYIGNDLSMVILLPGNPMLPADMNPVGLSDLDGKLTPENLRSWLAALDSAPWEREPIFIPRFTTTQSFNLAKTLKSMGMPSAFDDTADFSGMDGTGNLYISDVFHKTYVEVNEEGTEAAAATTVTMMLSAEPEPFVVNHPFIFLIRDKGSGAILFLGRIVDPTK